MAFNEGKKTTPPSDLKPEEVQEGGLEKPNKNIKKVFDVFIHIDKIKGVSTDFQEAIRAIVDEKVQARRATEQGDPNLKKMSIPKIIENNFTENRLCVVLAQKVLLYNIDFDITFSYLEADKKLIVKKAYEEFVENAERVKREREEEKRKRIEKEERDRLNFFLPKDSNLGQYIPDTPEKKWFKDSIKGTTFEESVFGGLDLVSSKMLDGFTQRGKQFQSFFNDLVEHAAQNPRNHRLGDTPATVKQRWVGTAESIRTEMKAENPVPFLPVLESLELVKGVYRMVHESEADIPKLYIGEAEEKFLEDLYVEFEKEECFDNFDPGEGKVVDGVVIEHNKPDVAIYSCVGTPADLYHGIDAFVEIKRKDQNGNEILPPVIITLDASIDPKKIYGTNRKADIHIGKWLLDKDVEWPTDSDMQADNKKRSIERDKTVYNCLNTKRYINEVFREILRFADFKQDLGDPHNKEVIKFPDRKGVGKHSEPGNKELDAVIMDKGKPFVKDDRFKKILSRFLPKKTTK